MEDGGGEGEDDAGGDGGGGDGGGEEGEGEVESKVGRRAGTTVQWGDHQGRGEGKEEEERTMMSKSLEPRCEGEEEDEDRWYEEEEGGCC